MFTFVTFPLCDNTTVQIHTYTKYVLRCNVTNNFGRHVNVGADLFAVVLVLPHLQLVVLCK